MLSPTHARPLSVVSSVGGALNPRKRSRSPSLCLPSLPPKRSTINQITVVPSPAAPPSSSSSSAPPSASSTRPTVGSPPAAADVNPAAAPSLQEQQPPPRANPSTSTLQQSTQLPVMPARKVSPSVASVVPGGRTGEANKVVAEGVPCSEAPTIGPTPGTEGRRPPPPPTSQPSQETIKRNYIPNRNTSSKARSPMQGVVELTRRPVDLRDAPCKRCHSLSIPCKRPPGPDQPTGAFASHPSNGRPSSSRPPRCYGCVGVDCECISAIQGPGVAPPAVHRPAPPVAPLPHPVSAPMPTRLPAQMRGPVGQYTQPRPPPPPPAGPVAMAARPPPPSQGATSAEERWVQERRMLMERVGWLEGEVGRLAESQAKLTRAFEERKSRKRSRMMVPSVSDDIAPVLEAKSSRPSAVNIEARPPPPSGPSPPPSALARAPPFPAPPSSSPAVSNPARSSPVPTPHGRSPMPAHTPRPNSSGAQTFTLPPSTTPLPSALAALPPAPFRRPAQLIPHPGLREDRGRQSQSPYQHPPGPSPSSHALASRRGSEISPGSQTMRDQPRRMSEHDRPPPPTMSDGRPSPSDLHQQHAQHPPPQQHRSTPGSWFPGVAGPSPLANPSSFASSSSAPGGPPPPRHWTGVPPPPPSGGWTSNTPGPVPITAFQRTGMSSPFAADATPRRGSGDGPIKLRRDSGPPDERRRLSDERRRLPPSSAGPPPHLAPTFHTQTTSATPTPPPPAPPARERLPSSPLPEVISPRNLPIRLPSSVPPPKPVSPPSPASAPISPPIAIAAAPKPAGGHSIVSLLAVAGSMAGRRGSFNSSGGGSGVGGFKESSMRGGSEVDELDEDEEEVEEERGGDERGRVGGVSVV